MCMACSALQREPLGDLLLQAADEAGGGLIVETARAEGVLPLPIGQGGKPGADPADIGWLDLVKERVVSSAPIAA